MFLDVPDQNQADWTTLADWSEPADLDSFVHLKQTRAESGSDPVLVDHNKKRG